MSEPSAAAGNVVTSGNGLLEKLQRETDEAVAACLAGARDEATRLRAAAERNALEQREQAIGDRMRTHVDACIAARSAAEQHVLRQTLQARADAVERVMQSASTQATLLVSHPRLVAMFRTDIEQALRCLPEGAVTVFCPSAYVPAARDAAALAGAADATTADAADAAAADATRITVQSDDTVGDGMIVRSNDGRVEVNATVARRLNSQRPRLSILVSRLLSELIA